MIKKIRNINLKMNIYLNGLNKRIRRIQMFIVYHAQFTLDPDGVEHIA